LEDLEFNAPYVHVFMGHNTAMEAPRRSKKRLQASKVPAFRFSEEFWAGASASAYTFRHKKEFTMSLLLPVLLLGLAQPADQPVNASPSPKQEQTQRNLASAFLDTPTFTLAAPKPGEDNPNSSNRRQKFDQIEVPPNPDAGPPVCLTMRSYYFERTDDLAPEFVGMTTCDSGRKLAQRRVNRPKARLVPAH
jgi:hypothetical protein